ncbi:hypothetical protein JBL43_04380 [Aureibaculum sp. A20]|uniref:DUF4249 family protein n=1 Tax=Aureibaculum flavum TaxID=2795986 RepID=A0ABS0WNF0_9FLAO|nr:hypothetical protein [Aureibaculum flavum]MBJ2173459.1 hypothetical protein [Aureibaculum flavum]
MMKNLNYVWVALVTFLLFSCDTELAEIDNDAPEVSIHISGPGVDLTLDNDMVTADVEINLLHNSVYTFTISANDGGTGGLERFLYQTDYRNFERISDIPNNFTATTVDNPGNDLDFIQYDWLGDRSNPKSGMIGGGTYKTLPLPPTHGLPSSSFIVGEAMDFRNSGGVNNQTRKYFNLTIVRENPGVVQL